MTTKPLTRIFALKQNLSKWIQIFAKYVLNKPAQIAKSFKIWQSGKISPKLVTLFG